jgi:hypothetical protein
VLKAATGAKQRRPRFEGARGEHVILRSNLSFLLVVRESSAGQLIPTPGYLFLLLNTLFLLPHTSNFDTFWQFPVWGNPILGV